MTSTQEATATMNLADYIDHTKLTFKLGEAPEAAIRTLCEEARDNRFFAVCVRPWHVALARQCLSGSNVLVATVIGFPQDKVELSAEQVHPTVGDVPTRNKLAEVAQALADGVDELDLVMNVEALKNDLRRQTHQVLDEFIAVQEASQGRAVKVIIETDLLGEAEMVQAARWCAEAGVAMVKTSTGMVGGGQGATLPNVQLIRRTLDEVPGGKSVGIKASGGVKNAAQARAFVEAGADRLGTSSGVAIVQGGATTGDY